MLQSYKFQTVEHAIKKLLFFFVIFFFEMSLAMSMSCIEITLPLQLVDQSVIFLDIC